MTITIKNKDFSSNINLATIMNVMTKVEMLKICNKLELELQLVDEFVKAGANHYAVRKMRKTYYKLQQYGLVLTYKDMENKQWCMLMPDSVRESLAPYYKDYLDLAEAGQKLPSKKQLRMMAALQAFRGKDD